MVKKTPRETDEAYLEHIRQQPCIAAPLSDKPLWWLECSGKIAPHHDPTVGAGGSDYTALPMCLNHHTEIHKLGRDSWPEKYLLDLNQERVKRLIGYIKILKEEL